MDRGQKGNYITVFFSFLLKAAVATAMLIRDIYAFISVRTPITENASGCPLNDVAEVVAFSASCRGL